MLALSFRWWAIATQSTRTAGRTLPRRAKLQHELALPLVGPVSHPDLVPSHAPFSRPVRHSPRPLSWRLVVPAFRLRRPAPTVGTRPAPTPPGQPRARRDPPAPAGALPILWADPGARLGPQLPASTRHRRDHRSGPVGGHVGRGVPASRGDRRRAGHDRPRLAATSACEQRHRPR